MKICVDPGHQSSPDLAIEPIAPGSKIMKPRTAPGTVGVCTKISEFEVALQIALLLELQLARRGFDVLLTRSSNEVRLSNIERAQLANSSGASLCVKIHCNGVRPLLRYVAFWKRGAMTLVPSRELSANIFDASMMVGKVMHRHIIRATHFPDLGIHERGDLSGFNWSSIPVVLLELGYLTNPTEEALLVSKLFQERIASAIADGIGELGKDLEL